MKLPETPPTDPRQRRLFEIHDHLATMDPDHPLRSEMLDELTDIEMRAFGPAMNREDFRRFVDAYYIPEALEYRRREGGERLPRLSTAFLVPLVMTLGIPQEYLHMLPNAKQGPPKKEHVWEMVAQWLGQVIWNRDLDTLADLRETLSLLPKELLMPGTHIDEVIAHLKKILPPDEDRIPFRLMNAFHECLSRLKRLPTASELDKQAGVTDPAEASKYRGLMGFSNLPEQAAL